MEQQRLSVMVKVLSVVVVILLAVMVVYWVNDARNKAAEERERLAEAERLELATTKFEIAAQSRVLINDILSETDQGLRDSADLVYRKWYDSLEQEAR